MRDQTYESTADVLVERIAALGPQILAIDDPWTLFKVEGFKCSDLEPSLFQASWALEVAKRRLTAARPAGEPA